MKRDSLIVYREWNEALSELSPEEKCFAWDAIMDYAFEGKIPEDKFYNVLTAMMRKQIDKDQFKYEDICKKRAEAGKKGGLKRKANASMREQMQANEIKYDQDNTNQAEYDNEYDNDKYTLLRKDDIYKREEIFGDNGLRIWIEHICRKLKINEEEFDKFAKSFIEESACRNWNIGKEFPNTRSLFFSWVTNQINNQINESKQEDKFSRRRGADPCTWTAEDFKEGF